ncbi:MAG: hypothetical protein ABH827_01520 [bacterium]
MMAVMRMKNCSGLFILLSAFFVCQFCFVSMVQGMKPKTGGTVKSGKKKAGLVGLSEEEKKELVVLEEKFSSYKKQLKAKKGKSQQVTFSIQDRKKLFYLLWQKLGMPAETLKDESIKALKDESIAALKERIDNHSHLFEVYGKGWTNVLSAYKTFVGEWPTEKITLEGKINELKELELKKVAESQAKEKEALAKKTEGLEKEKEVFEGQKELSEKEKEDLKKELEKKETEKQESEAEAKKKLEEEQAKIKKLEEDKRQKEEEAKKKEEEDASLKKLKEQEDAKKNLEDEEAKKKIEEKFKQSEEEKKLLEEAYKKDLKEKEEAHKKELEEKEEEKKKLEQELREKDPLYIAIKKFSNSLEALKTKLVDLAQKMGEVKDNLK